MTLTDLVRREKIAVVPAVDVVVETTLALQDVRDALLDFSRRRPEIWPGLTPSLYEVYAVSDHEAEIKEGTKMPVGQVWARERYEWSEPNVIRWTVQESNFCTPGSYVSATLTAREQGGTRIAIHWERTGSTLVGKIICRMIALTSGKPISGSMEKALRQLETSGRPAAPTA